MNNYINKRLRLYIEGRRPELYKCSDCLKRWVETQHNIYVVKCLRLVNNEITGKKSYLLEGYIFSALFEATSHCF